MKTSLRITRASQQGVVLITALLLLTVMTMIGVSAMSTSGVKEKMAGQQRAGTSSLLEAEAGIREAVLRLREFRNEASYAINSTWKKCIGTTASASAYFGCTAAQTSGSNQSQLNNYTVLVSHKTEYDAELNGHTDTLPHYADKDGTTTANSALSPGNVLRYGYNDATATARYFTAPSFPASARPVFVITARGSGGADRAVQIEVVYDAGIPPVGTIYSKGNAQFNGSSASVSGIDNNCGYPPAAPAVPPVYNWDGTIEGTLVGTPGTTSTSGSPTFLGDPASPKQGPINIDIAGYVNTLKQGAITFTDPTSMTFGSSSAYGVWYKNGSTTINSKTGYGILLIEGDLSLGGGFTWNGLILVTGNVTLNGGGGGTNIRGALYANSVLNSNGGLDLRYDSCHLNLASSNRPPQITRWIQIQ